MTVAVHWTPEMVQALRDLRSGGLPLYLCAERIGVSYSTAVYKAREMNLAQRLNRGRRPGWQSQPGNAART
ncbi:MAG: hypothetical protein ABSC06_35460 [Rhodopila sp.]|jgi:hypothetical protein